MGEIRWRDESSVQTTLTGCHRKPSAFLNPKPHTIALVAGTYSRISSKCSSTRTSSAHFLQMIISLPFRSAAICLCRLKEQEFLHRQWFRNPLHIARGSCHPCQQLVDLLPYIKKISLGKFIPASPLSQLLISNRNRLVFRIISLF